VLVSVLNVLVVDMGVSVGLSIVTVLVLVLVLDVFMIVQDMRMGVRHVIMCVLMGMLRCGHRFVRP